MNDQQLPQNGKTDGFLERIAGALADTLVAGDRVLIVGMDKLEVERFLADWLDSLDEDRVEYEALEIGTDYRIVQSGGRISAVSIDVDERGIGIDLNPRQQVMAVILPTSSMTEQAEQAVASAFAQIVQSLPRGGVVATRVSKL